MHPNQPTEKAFADLISGMEAMFKKTDEDDLKRRQDYAAGREWNHYSAAEPDLQLIFAKYQQDVTLA